MQPGAVVTIRNGKIEMYKGSMRLVVDKWGKLEPVEGKDFTVNEENNISDVEYELVTVDE